MRLIVEDKNIVGVPCTMYYKSKHDCDCLVLVGHGYTGSRNDCRVVYLSTLLAKEGFFVVAYDSENHGDLLDDYYLNLSQEEKDAAFTATCKETSSNVKNIIDYIKTNARFKIKKVGMTGISMGGIITFTVASKFNCLDVIVPIIATPDVHYFDVNTEEKFITKMDGISYYTENNPINNVKGFTKLDILILNGNEDDIVPIEPVREFYEELKVIHKKNIRLKEYEVGHYVVDNMIYDTVNWFKDHLK